MKFIRIMGPFRQFLLVCSLLLMVFAMLAKDLYQSEAFNDQMMLYVSAAMAPIFFFLLLFDVLMNRVQIADRPEAEQGNYRCFIRIELITAVLLVLSWLPFLSSILG